MRHENMTAWAATEDNAILQGVERYGPRWSKIATELPGRSVASVRNRYLRMQKGLKKQSEGIAKNRCHACGQLKLGHVCSAQLANVAPRALHVMAPPPVWRPPPDWQPRHDAAGATLALFTAASLHADETLDDWDDVAPSSSSASSVEESTSVLLSLSASETDEPSPTVVDGPPAPVRRPSLEEEAALSVLLLKKNLGARSHFAC